MQRKARMKLIKLPLRLAAILIPLALLALQLIGAVLIGLSSVVTHLLASVFLLGAVARWLVHAQPWMVWQAVGIYWPVLRLCSKPCGMADEQGDRLRSPHPLPRTYLTVYSSALYLFRQSSEQNRESARLAMKAL